VTKVRHALPDDIACGKLRDRRVAAIGEMTVF